MRKILCLWSMLLVALVAYSQGIRIVEPLEGTTVKGEVPIRIEGADRGYAILTLDGEFLAALNLPSDFKWNTQAPYGFRLIPLKDGEHTLAVKVYDGTELLGEAQVKITLKNKIDFPLGEPVKLAYRYKEGEEHTWKTKASREEVDLELQWKEFCNEVLQPTGIPPVILLTHRVEKGGFIYQRRGIATYPEIGNYFFLSIFQNGEKADIRSLLRATFPGGTSPQMSPQKLFGWGQLRITFPDTGVKLQEEWQSSLIFVADIESGEPQLAVGRHRIEDVVWMKGYKCFKIRSTFEWRGEISAGGQVGTGIGMVPGMMMPGMMGPGATGPGGMMPGVMGPAGMMQGMTSSALAPQPSQVTTPSGAAVPSGAGAMPGAMGVTPGRATGKIPVSVEGARTTYFAFEEGKIVKIEDEIKVRPRTVREREGGAPLEGAMPSGMMPGMMGPGTMGPGTMPSGMMPGMMGPETMGPGAMLGMTAFAGGPSATPAGRAMGPYMAGPSLTPLSAAYTLKVVSEMTE